MIPIYIVMNRSHHRACPCISGASSSPNRSTGPSAVSLLLLQHPTRSFSAAKARESVQCASVWLPGGRVCIFFAGVRGLLPSRFLKHCVEGVPVTLKYRVSSVLLLAGWMRVRLLRDQGAHPGAMLPCPVCTLERVHLLCSGVRTGQRAPKL